MPGSSPPKQAPLGFPMPMDPGSSTGTLRTCLTEGHHKMAYPTIHPHPPGCPPTPNIPHGSHQNCGHPVPLDHQTECPSRQSHQRRCRGWHRMASTTLMLFCPHGELQGPLLAGPVVPTGLTGSMAGASIPAQVRYDNGVTICRDTPWRRLMRHAA